jgi:glycolate oxidase
MQGSTTPGSSGGGGRGGGAGLAAGSELVRKLASLLPPEALVTSRYGRAMYYKDAGFLNAEPLAVCLPGDVAELAAVVRACAEHGVGVTPRGAGTGLAGGAVPLGGTVVVGTARMNRILEIDVENRQAWVEPGVENLRLDRMARRSGLRYAPDPSSQTACSIGGNVGTNAGGAHCLAHGVTSWHVLALDLMDCAGEVHRLGSPAPEENGYDLRGVVVGAEGTFGIVTGVCLRLLPLPEHVQTLLLAFGSVRAAAETVSEILLRGNLPVALELMDQAAVRLVEGFAHAGYPEDAGAILLVEFEGMEHEVAEGVAATIEAARRRGSMPRVAADERERARLWKGRKAIAGAMAQAAPDFYLHDVVVPRSRLADMLDEVLRIAREEEVVIVNVLHAGDGNLHPLILFDRTQPGSIARVFRAGDRIVETAVAIGGVLSGEHGIGLEKRDYLYSSEVMEPAELELHARLRRAMDPAGLFNPGKKVVALPSGAAAPLPSMVPEGAWL